GVRRRLATDLVAELEEDRRRLAGAQGQRRGLGFDAPRQARRDIGVEADGDHPLALQRRSAMRDLRRAGKTGRAAEYAVKRNRREGGTKHEKENERDGEAGRTVAPTPIVLSRRFAHLKAPGAGCLAPASRSSPHRTRSPTVRRRRRWRCCA